MKEYNHHDIETKWQKEWEKTNLYATKEPKWRLFGKAKKKYILDMFPYPSGSGLHVGHPRGYLATDVYSRMSRMQGYSVLHPMGWDAFGLPAENFAIKNKIHPREAVEKNVARFKDQLSILGMDYDWSREINTTDPEYYKWTQWMFLKMYEKGLAYQSNEPINWCPGCNTGLANEDIEPDGTCESCKTPVEKKSIPQWVLKITAYADRLLTDLDQLPKWPEGVKEAQRNWIGRSEGAEIKFKLQVEGKKKILIGTRNEAKVKMITECFPETSEVEFLSLNDLPAIDDSGLVEGEDFEENARRKAEFYFKKTGIPTISTDNIFWCKKWPKNNGNIIHVRKEANPNSERANDEEVNAFLKKWIDENGGSSPAHFVYAIAYADSTGVRHLSFPLREYILQSKQSQKFWEGYPIECLLIDVETGEYKGDQVNTVRYNKLIEHFEKEVKPWVISSVNEVEIFTTRPDTLFGATYLVLAPEHPLVTGFLSSLSNKDEVIAYVQKTKEQSDIERNAEGKEKTGVQLQGVKAINPANKEEIPVFIADYVLASYGTGAIMAVPAHDERDYAFAKKFDLPIKRVVEPKFVAQDKNDGAMVRPELPFVKRNAICAVVRNPKDDTYLCINWKTDFVMHGLVTGGYDEGEDPVEAAKREVREETGYKNLRLVWNPGIANHTQFYHRVKKENRWARFTNLFFELENEDRDPVDEKESKLHEVLWKKKSELRDFFSVFEGQFIWELLNNKEYLFTGSGVLYNSGEFSWMDSEEAKRKITEFVGGKMKTIYRMKDWVFSRQRYWGEPIPMIHCKKCGVVPVSEKDLPVRLPEVSHYEPSGTGESPLATISDWVNTQCPKCRGEGKRETNTMPQWAGSSWYYLRYIDPKNSDAPVARGKENKWMPVDVYVGGDHATRHLIYARFWHKVLHDIGVVSTSEPFPRLEFLGYILAEDGKKFSKRSGNGIDPADIVDRFGADSFRLYEMFIGPFEATAPWSTNGLVGTRRFVEKVWKLGLRIKDQGSSEDNKKLTALLHKTIKKVSEDIENFKFNTAVSAMMIFANEAESTGKITKEEYKIFLQLLAPFAPHVTEELWYAFGEKESIHLSKWPAYDAELAKDTEITVAVQVNGKMRATVSLSPTASEEIAKEIALAHPDIKKWIEGKSIKRFIYQQGRIINVVV